MISFISNRLVSGAAPPLREAADISVNEGRILIMIDTGAANTAARLKRIIGIDQAAISRCVQRMVERRLIVSTPDQHHGKRNILSLTPRGAQYARGMSRFNDERQRFFLSTLSESERSFLSGILARLLTKVDATNEVTLDPAWFDDRQG